MKKKLLLLCLAVLLLCMLAGCECKHEWIDADCLTAKTCSKCEVVEGEPLGHAYAAATCEAPETCTRCGVTQGEMLPHVYGEWILGETKMTRLCENCQATETAELDRELCLKEALTGHWDLYGIRDQGQFRSAYDYKDDFFYYFTAYADGRAVIYNGEKNVDVTWKYVDYEIIKDVTAYYFNIEFEDDTVCPCVIMDLDEDELYFTTGDNSYILLTKNKTLATAMSGFWAAAHNGEVYSLTLNEDRSFAGSWDSEVSGTWHLKPVYSEYGYKSSRLTFRFTQNGEERVETVYLSLCPEETALEDYLLYNTPYIGLRVTKDDYVNFAKMREEDVAALKTALEEGPRKIHGTWDSTKVHTYMQETGTSNERKTDGLSITFAEDGTFSATLDKERKGTWKFEEASVDSGWVYYSYVLHFDGVSDEVHASISNEELSFGNYRKGISSTVYFEQMTAEKIAAREAAMQEGIAGLTGTWNSTSMSEYDSRSGTSQYKNNLDYTITFSGDGTFTAALDQERSGTWEFSDWYVYEDQYNRNVSYYFYLYFDGVSETVRVSLSDSGIYLSADSRSISFKKQTAEEQNVFRTGLELPVGTWTAVSATHFDPQANLEEQVDCSGYSLTVQADNTFSASFGDNTSGTWYLSSHDVDYGYSYMFFYGMNSSYSGRMEEDGKLTIFIWNSADSSSVSIEMTRN